MACSHVNDDTLTSGNGATLTPRPEEIVRIRTVIGLPDSLLPRAAAIICHAYFYRFSSVSCSDVETLAILRESLNDRTLIGAFLGEELVGLAVLRSGGRPRVKKPSSFLRSLLIRWAPVNKADVVIEALAVDTPRRRSGVGSLVVKAAVEYAHVRKAGSIRLEVVADNSCSVAFFLAQGFVRVKAWSFSALLWATRLPKMVTMTSSLS